MSCTLRRHTNHLRSFLVVLGLVCMTGVLAPLSAGAIEDAPGSTVFSIPVPNYFKENASSSGDVVVWDRSQYDSGISGYDLSEKKSFNVPIPTGGIARRPKVCGDWVLFEVFFKKSSARNIFAYDRSDGSVTAVTNGKGQRSAVEVDGDIAVWEAYEPDPADYRSEDTNIYGKNLSTGETFTVTPVSGEHHSPDVAGDWVVYSDWKGGRGKSVRAFNITTKTTKTLCDWAGDQYYPRISSSGFVVWQNVRDPKHVNETTDLYGRSVNGGPIRKIAGGSGSQDNPTIGGSVIVYQDDRRPGGYRLLGYDLLSNTRFGISKRGSADYYVAGIQDGTIARLYTKQEVYPRRTSVQLIWPTQLEVIADDPAIDEALDVGDDDLIADATPASLPSGFASLPAAASVSTVVVSAANDWPGTVIASSLAGRRSPLLLTGTASVPSTVLAKLAKLSPAHVVVVGGPSSVSATAFAQLQSVVGTAAVTRVPGADDESRSLAVASILESHPGWNGTVLVVSRGSASAALMAVPASVRKGLPLVLADSKGLSGSQIAGLVTAGAKRFVVVGAGVPKSTTARLKAAVGTSRVKLIRGTSTASTSVRFASWATSSLGMSWNRLGIASNATWSHTLTGALSKGRIGSVLLMTNPKTLSGPVKSALVKHDRSIRRVSFVGGRSIVSTKVRKYVRLAIK